MPLFGQYERQSERAHTSRKKTVLAQNCHGIYEKERNVKDSPDGEHFEHGGTLEDGAEVEATCSEKAAETFFVTSSHAPLRRKRLQSFW